MHFHCTACTTIPILEHPVATWSRCAWHFLQTLCRCLDSYTPAVLLADWLHFFPSSVSHVPSLRGAAAGGELQFAGGAFSLPPAPGHLLFRASRPCHSPQHNLMSLRWAGAMCSFCLDYRGEESATAASHLHISGPLTLK